MRAAGPVRLPPHGPGLRIGLYGGSFDPPHAAHRLVALAAMRRLRLDRVWWLVVPQNPLKRGRDPAALAERLVATRRIAAHPRMGVTDVEAALGTSYTVDTLRRLLRRGQGAQFVWIMGADSWAGFHRWRSWRQIAGLVPVAVVDRPGFTLRATSCRAAIAFRSARLPEAAIPSLADHRPPAWAFLYGPRSNLSSTALRAVHSGAFRDIESQRDSPIS